MDEKNDNTKKVEAKELPIKRTQRKIRKLIKVGIILSFLWILVQFGFHRIDENYNSAEGRFRAGSLLIYDRFFDYHGAGCMPQIGTDTANLHRFDFVLYGHKTESGVAWLILKIVGMPGDEIKKIGDEILIAGNYSFGARSDFTLPEGETIPARKFFLINHRADSNFPDSRNFGLVDAEMFSGKAIISIGS